MGARGQGRPMYLVPREEAVWGRALRPSMAPWPLTVWLWAREVPSLDSSFLPPALT